MNVTKHLLPIFLLCIIPTVSLCQNGQVEVKNGKMPVIDGKIEAEEWDGASKMELYGGKSVFFLISNGNLYVAVKGNSGGFTSLGIGSHSEIKILHSSTGLITAAYEKASGIWKLLYDFKEPLNENGKQFPRNEIRLSEEYKRAQIQQFDWYASLIEMNDPSETEFQIPLSSLPRGDIFFSIVFFQIKADIKKAKLPGNLSDGMLNQGLIAGSASEGLQFEPETWIKLTGLR